MSNFQFRIWFSPHIISAIRAKNVKLWLVRKDDFVPKRIIFINIGSCKSQYFFFIYRINIWLVSQYFAIKNSALFQIISLVCLIELCLQVFPRSFTFLSCNVSWTCFCSQFWQSRYMICRPRVIGYYFSFTLFSFTHFGIYFIYYCAHFRVTVTETIS